MFLVFLILILISSVSTEDGNKVIIVWGEYMDTTSGYDQTSNWDGCVSQCLNQPQCAMIVHYFQMVCYLYKAESITTPITKKDESSGMRIGFKRTLDSCPENPYYDPPLFGEKLVEERYVPDTITYTYTISETYNLDDTITWNIDFLGIMECPENTMTLVRGSQSVCIILRPFPIDVPCDIQSSAEYLCMDSGDKGLAGLYSIDEGNMLAEKLPEYCRDMEYSNCNFWIDGYRFDRKSFFKTDDSINGTTGYNWYETPAETDNYWKCAFLASGSVENRGSLSGYVVIQECSITTDNTYCQRGAICLARPGYVK